MKKLTYGYLTSLLLAAFLLPAFTGMAQEAWTLDSCVQYAIENNIQIKQQTLNVNYRENQETQAHLDRLPTLNGQMGYDFNFGRSLNYDNTYTDQNSQDVSFYVGSEVTLFQMMARNNTVKQRHLELQAALMDLEKARDDIALNVVSAYLEILFNKELVATANEQLTLTQLQIDHNRKQVEAGNLARGKLLETEAQLASEELTLTNYENQLKLSLINLEQLLELPLSDGFDIVIPEIDASAMTKSLLMSESVYDRAVQERPEILSKEFTLSSLEKQAAIAKAQLYPTLTAGASYYTNYNNKYRYPAVPGPGELIPFGEQFENNRRLNVGLTLRIPVFNGYTARTNYKNAVIQYESGRYDLQLEKNNLRKQIEQVHANAIAALKKYESSQKAVKSAEEAFRYVQEKFNLGIVTPLEFNDSKNKVTTAQSSFIQAKYEYIFRVKILDFYNGVAIQL